jgi:two-component system, NtrC family, sensor histidine kinase HydH
MTRAPVTDMKKTIPDKAKPFRLVKYFTFSSLIVIFLVTLVLSFFNTHWARSMQLKKSEDYALLLIENLNHQVFLQFIIPIALKHGRIQLRNRDQFERMDQVVRSTLHSFQVDMVNIYDMNNIVSYSFDPDMVGMENMGGTGYQNAISGKTVSKLLQRGNLWEIFLGIPKESKLFTFAPLRAEQTLAPISGPVLGVVEIVQDLSEDYQTIFSFQIRIIATSTVVMGVLFLILLFLVKRGEGIIEARAIERLRLKEELSTAQRLSSLGKMVAGISHEIRNPLGIIRSSAEHLKKKMAGAGPAEPFADIIVEESNRLNNIITDFLDFAKPKNPNLVPCRVTDILEKNLAFLSSQLEEKKCWVLKNLPENAPRILGDPDMLYQAFLNLLLNAMHAMPEGGEIRVSANGTGKTVKIVLQDAGKGIPPDLLEKIWDPFFTTRATGTGLGLGIVKNIIESHSGSIHINNGEIAGACVTVELPAAP